HNEPSPLAAAQPGATGNEPFARTKPRRMEPIQQAQAEPLQDQPTTIDIVRTSTVLSPARPNLNWLPFLAVLWLAGAIFFLVRCGASIVRLRRLLQRALPVRDAEWNLQIQAISEALKLRRNITLLKCDETDVPFASGTVSPKIILPLDHEDWSPLRRNAVL